MILRPITVLKLWSKEDENKLLHHTTNKSTLPGENDIGVASLSARQLSPVEPRPPLDTDAPGLVMNA
jgi:hypothetical protein